MWDGATVIGSVSKTKRRNNIMFVFFHTPADTSNILHRNRLAPENMGSNIHTHTHQQRIQLTIVTDIIERGFFIVVWDGATVIGSVSKTKRRNNIMFVFFHTPADTSNIHRNRLAPENMGSNIHTHTHQQRIQLAIVTDVIYSFYATACNPPGGYLS